MDRSGEGRFPMMLAVMFLVATVTLLGPMNLLGLLIMFAVLPDYGRLRSGLVAGEWALAGVMLGPATPKA